MKFYELLSQIGVLLFTKLLVTEGRSSSASAPLQNVAHICPQQPVEFTCTSTHPWLQWRITFGGSLTLSAVTKEYLLSDPVGDTHIETRNGLNFAFQLTVSNQSQLVSVMTVTLINTNTVTSNMTVHCGQDIHHLLWIAVQDPPASPVIGNKSITRGSGDNHGIAIGLEWTLTDDTMVNSYVINVFPSIASTSTFTTFNTSIRLFILYNQEYNISVVATNCAGNSTPTETDVKIGYCASPMISSNVTAMGNISGLEGTMITYHCQQSVDNSPAEQMVAVCTRDGNWSPNPNELECNFNHTMTTVELEGDNPSSTTIDPLFTAGRKPNSLTLISVTFTISLILVLMFGLLMGFLLAKCCLKPYPMFKNNKKKASQTVDSSAPIYEQVIYTGHIVDKNSIELEGNVAYGPIQPKLSA